RFALPLALLTLSVVSSAADAQQSTGRRILAPTTAKSGAQPVAGAQEATGAQSATDAQSATSAQAASNSASPASGCDFETADGFSLPFETCRAGNASGAAFTGALTAAAANGKEVEIVEYRNGDSQHRQRVIFEGRDRN